VVYRADWDEDWRRWSDFYFGDGEYSVERDGESVRVRIDSEDTYVYLAYIGEFQHADVQIDVDVETVGGPNLNNMSVICRYSDDGWYEFNVFSGGLYTLMKFQEHGDGYQMLKSGGSTAIKSGTARNHVTAVCAGETLTLYVNDVQVASVKDSEFEAGTFGVSASTFEIAGVHLGFDDFTVRLADPDAQLGGSVAPTVAPSAAGGAATAPAWLPGLYTFPVPGETTAPVEMQRATLDLLLPLITRDVQPGCQDVRVTSTRIVQSLPPGPFVDAFGGSHDLEVGIIERWEITRCGAVSAFNMTYLATTDGGLSYYGVRA
jgi:hypothetical protein